jgi:hypothetical protein
LGGRSALRHETSASYGLPRKTKSKAKFEAAVVRMLGNGGSSSPRVHSGRGALGSIDEQRFESRDRFRVRDDLHLDHAAPLGAPRREAALEGSFFTRT